RRGADEPHQGDRDGRPSDRRRARRPRAQVLQGGGPDDSAEALKLPFPELVSRSVANDATRSRSIARVRRAMRAIMAVVYAMAGVLHLVVPDKFMLIVPDWVPFR